MPNPNEVPQHVEPAEAMLLTADPGALAAMDAALGITPETPPAPVDAPPADPQPGDTLAPPDSAPKAPEGDAESDPDDNAPASQPPKPDDKKTEVPTDPKADDPAVDPTKQAKPSDEFGELPADVPVKTRERFDAMKGKYDEVTAERDSYKEQASGWVETVKSTGATPEQFGMSLQYLKAVNSGTPEGLRAAFDIMKSEMTVLAEALGEEVPGFHDPLAKHPDLLKRVNDEDSEAPLTRKDALEIAGARQRDALAAHSRDRTNTDTAEQARVDTGLQQVATFGELKKATDPHYAVKTAAIRPLVERVVSNLPPEQWAASIKELYEAQPNPVVAAPPPPPVPPTPIRPTGTPAAGGGLDKKPGSALEAMNAALEQL